MQRIGKDFIIKQMSMNMVNGETHVLCELPGGAWILGSERNGEVVRSMEQVQEFPASIQAQVQRWLTQVEGNPELAKPSIMTQEPVKPPDDTAALLSQLNPDVQQQIAETIRAFVTVQQDSLRAGTVPDVNTHADGYGQDSTVPSIDSTLQQAVESSGGRVEVNEQGQREWKPGKELLDALGGGDSVTERVNPGAPEPSGSGAEQVQVPIPSKGDLEREVGQLA